MKMKAIGSEISAAVFLLAIAMGGRSIQEVGALSGNGAAATTTRSRSKPSTIFKTGPRSDYGSGQIPLVAGIRFLCTAPTIEGKCVEVPHGLEQARNMASARI